MDKETEDVIKRTIINWLDATYRERLELVIDHKATQLEKEFDQRVLIAIARKFFAPAEIVVSVETKGIKDAESNSK